MVKRMKWSNYDDYLHNGVVIIIVNEMYNLIIDAFSIDFKHTHKLTNCYSC